MKTYRNLYPQVYDFENLYQAYRAARLGKRGRGQVARGRCIPTEAWGGASFYRK